MTGAPSEPVSSGGKQARKYSPDRLQVYEYWILRDRHARLEVHMVSTGLRLAQAGGRASLSASSRLPLKLTPDRGRGT